MSKSLVAALSFLLSTAPAPGQPSPAVPAANAGSGAAAFAALAGLVGVWEGVPANGRPHRVTYRLIGRGSALVESWAFGPTNESMTVYTVEDDRLVATHYCNQGNQPRLALAEQLAPATYRFALIGGANLGQPGRSHQSGFVVHLIDRDRMQRSETYVPNDGPATPAEPDEVVTYRRVGDR